MPTSAFNKFNCFTQDLGNAVHKLSTDVLKVALTNTAPVATNAVLADIVQIGANGGYTAGGYTLDSVTWTTASGVAKLAIADEVITATGTMDLFRYAVVYNSTPVAGNLIGWVDYGSSIAPQIGEKFTLDFDNTNGVFTVT